MSLLAFPCRWCKHPLDVRVITTDLGQVRVYGCIQCDRRNCGKCEKKTGGLFGPGLVRCDQCGRRMT